MFSRQFEFTRATVVRLGFAWCAIAAVASAQNARFALSFNAGQRDAAGRFMGGTEMRRLETHRGLLFGGIETWKDTQTGTDDPAHGAQIVRLDSPGGRWVLDLEFSERIPGGTGRNDFRHEGVTALESLKLTNDGEGRPLPAPITLLIAACRDFTGAASVYVRDDASGRWSETVLARTATGDATIRALAVHRDRVTGADRVFAGSLPTGLFSAVYDRSLGALRWDVRPELTGYTGRPMAFAVCEGALHVAIAPRVYRRRDGTAPIWEEVFRYDFNATPGGSSGLRGLTTVPTPGGAGGESLLAMLEGNAARMVRLDPRPVPPYVGTVELDVIADLSAAWGYRAQYVVGANSDMTPLRDPATGEALHLITVQHHPARARSDAHYYVRRQRGGSFVYELRRIDPLLVDTPTTLNSTRAVAVSPFTGDAAGVIYLGGYDADDNPSHNTAYVVRSSLSDVLTGDGAAQPLVRAWSAAGQTWIVWRYRNPAPVTFEIHRLAAPSGALGAATLVGRLFPADWSGDLLARISPDFTLVAPNAAGGRYALARDEGIFAYTPRAASNDYFAVVRSGTSSAGAAELTTGPVLQPFAPETLPIMAHLQAQGVDAKGNPVAYFAHWLDGRDEAGAARADYPIMGNAGSNGTPRLFAVWDPLEGMPAAGVVPSVFWMHGRGGSFLTMEPSAYARADMRLPKATLVSLDDNQFVFGDDPDTAATTIGTFEEATRWLGYWERFDRFDANRTPPPADAVVVPYTLRRVAWTRDWLVRRRRLDPQRTALMGHSMGAAGVGFSLRYQPENWSTATAFEGPVRSVSTGIATFMQGTGAQNLRTALPGSPGVQALYRLTTRISPLDLPPWRLVWGTTDENVAWNSGLGPTYADIDSLEAARLGTQIFWDERAHEAAQWTGRWVGSPRHTAAFTNRFGRGRSFPAFSEDIHPRNDVRQAWGTRAGYYDWDDATLVDQPTLWRADLWIIGRSAFANENAPFRERRVCRDCARSLRL